MDYKAVIAPAPSNIPPSFLAKQKSRPQSAKVAAITSLADITNNNDARVTMAATTILGTGLDWSERMEWSPVHDFARR